LPVFEGPLDLLLHLIEREELDITHVSLARVADQYLAYLDALEELRVADLSDFIVLAARLILIKSEALLPRPSTALPQEAEDAGDALIRQLRAYKAYRETAKRLAERQASGHRSYVRLAPLPRLDTGIEHLEPIPLAALLEAARRTLETSPASPSRVDEVVSGFSLTITDQIGLIRKTLQRQYRTSFRDLLTEGYSRQEVGVTLLALLELIKQRQVQASQDRMFGRIVIFPWNANPAPS
jgi:segregation and condensation protein A